jgi:hypothetical protein
VRKTAQRKHYAPSTGKNHAHWIKRSILFHGKRHSSEMAAQEVEAFLTHLAVEQRVNGCPLCFPRIKSAKRSAITPLASRNAGRRGGLSGRQAAILCAASKHC